MHVRKFERKSTELQGVTKMERNFHGPLGISKDWVGSRRIPKDLNIFEGIFKNIKDFKMSDKNSQDLRGF